MVERRRQAADIARAILDGSRGICDGCRALTNLAHYIVPDWRVDPDFVVFGALSSDSDRFPLGDVRQRWHPDLLAKLDKEREQFEERARPKVRAACQSVVNRFGAGSQELSRVNHPSRSLSEDEITIFVELIGEGTSCWRPVRATQLGEGMFRVVAEQCVPENERWAYEPGQIVWCEERTFSDGTRGLVATRTVLVG